MEKRVVLFGLVAVLMSGCGGGDSTTTTTTTTSTSVTPTSLPTSFVPNDGRLLASNCYGCHGTDGVSTTKWDSIAGEDELHEEMFESDGIMLAQAKGYSDDEIAKMEEFLKSLPKSDSDDDDSYDSDDSYDDDDDD
ncbi:MAG: cytochrome c class I [Epsilonproteobacteria bacterium]|nr:cytochrome c class I [Campylobacterota bacterium]